MAQSRAKDIEEKEEAGRHKRAPQPIYDQRKEAAMPEDSRTGLAEAMLNLQQTYGNRYVQRIMGRAQAKLTVGSPNDEYEREADKVADVVTRAPASSVQRQAEEEEEEKRLQTKMPRIQRQPAAETKAEAPKAEAPKAAIDKSRVAALKVMFEAAVVGPCRTAYEALGQKEPDAKLAFKNIGTANTVLRSMIPPYKGVEPMYTTLIATGNALGIFGNELRPHVGKTKPLTHIRDTLNPDGETMSTYFKRIRSLF